MMTDEAHALPDNTSPSRYNSFLLRCWHVGDGELRIKLEHIQSGNSAQVDTYEAATAWLSEHCALASKHPSPGSPASLVDDGPRRWRGPDTVRELE